MTIIYSLPTAAAPVTKRDDGLAIGLDSSPAAVAVFIDLDQVRSRAHLLELFAAVKAAIVAEVAP